LVFVCLFVCFCFVVQRLDLRAFTLSQSTSPFFVIRVFEIGFYESFAQAGFTLWSSWSLPPE
jgi:hypothetical protein